MISIIKNQNVSLKDLLLLAKKNNSNPQTSKKVFNMHLDDFEFNALELSYLNKELEQFELK